MDGAKFDRLARVLSTIQTRRRVMAIFGAVASMMAQRAARGAQLTSATCGEEGAACTLTFGCCDGLTCVTSAINTSYGICVPGDGGMVSTGSTLISPFSETAVEDVTALMPTTSSASTTDPQAEREAHIAEIRDRKSANRTDRRTRLDARRARKHTPNTPNGTLSFGPRLSLKLTTSIRDGKQVDIVEATNRADTSVVLTRIASLPALDDSTSLTSDPSKLLTLDHGEWYFFVAGPAGSGTPDTQLNWRSMAVCDGTAGAGYLVSAALTVDSENKNFKILCPEVPDAAAVETASSAPRRKGKRNNQQQKKKKR
jgi:hypothetical protein